MKANAALPLAMGSIQVLAHHKRRHTTMLAALEEEPPYQYGQHCHNRLLIRLLWLHTLLPKLVSHTLFNWYI